ncbi:MAG: HlyD family type I secretion periplasmic adaptor subunit [Cyanobacteria bacterium P01_A01_bin.3]
MIRILIVDDLKTVRQMLRMFVEHQPDMEVIGTAADGDTALEQIAMLQPDVALVDLEMPGTNGLDVVKAAGQNHPNTKILVLTTMDGVDVVSQALQAGAKGYLLKTASEEDLLSAIRSVHKGFVQLSPGMLERLVDANNTGSALAPVGTGAAIAAADDVTALAAKSPTQQDLHRFDQPVVLRQDPVWSRWILRTIVGASAGAILWATFAKIEAAVPARGKLEPSGTVQEVQVPVPGVVSEIFIREGETVEAGDLMMRLDATVSTAQAESIQERRSLLQEERAVYQALIANRAEELSWSSEASDLYRSNSERFRADGEAARLQIDQLRQQLAQANVQLRNERANLELNETILGDIEPLFEEGGVSRLQYLRQQQEVQTNLSEIERITEQQNELNFAIAQASEQVTSTTTEYQRNWNTRLREVDQQLIESESELTQVEQTQLYEEIRAPISGTIFDLQTPRVGAVVNNSEPVVRIVPGDTLVARVFITNRDIGFLRIGMPVDVRIDSYSYSEFGDIKGELVHIGSDALPPDPETNRQFEAFPAEIQLDAQVLQVNEIDFPLQSGMSISANIRTRQRRVISIFTEQFQRGVVDPLIQTQ